MSHCLWSTPGAPNTRSRVLIIQPTRYRMTYYTVPQMKTPNKLCGSIYEMSRNKIGLYNNNSKREGGIHVVSFSIQWRDRNGERDCPIVKQSTKKMKRRKLRWQNHVDMPVPQVIIILTTIDELTRVYIDTSVELVELCVESIGFGTEPPRRRRRQNRNQHVRIAASCWTTLCTCTP